MKKIISVIILSTIWTINLFAQNPYKPFDDIKPYIMDYESHEAIKILNTNKSTYEPIHYYYQALATALAMNGHKYDSIMICELMGGTGSIPIKIEQEIDLIDISSLNISAGKERIVELSQTESVMIFNESHTRPQHRLFIKSVLAGMYKHGYRQLCLEALEYKIDNYSTIKEITDLGFYTKEPFYAEMMREALRLDYKVYGYEATSEDYQHSNNRDSLQAAHLSDIFKDGTHGKMVVVAGHGHISKKSPKSMYNYFTNISKTTPLTIEQAMHSERIYPNYENLLYQTIINTYPEIREPLSLENVDNKYADIYIFTPRIKYINDRPDFVLENKERRFQKIKVDQPSVIKAYYDHEYKKYGDKCVPLDIIIADRKQIDTYYLSVNKKGKFKIVVIPLN